MSYLMHPWLLVAGVCAVCVPILIHLLNRRRFRVVDWAAMDFLLEADKQSRRKIRLQHWLLLALRCLAIGLVGLLLARPLIPTQLTGGLVAAPFERIIVLDDSLSMQAGWGNESAFERAKRTAKDLINQFAAQHGGRDRLTLRITSQMNEPLLVAAPLTPARLDEWETRLNALNCSDAGVVFSSAVGQLSEALRSQESGVNRVVYALTDLRQPDWQDRPSAGQASAKTSVESLKQLSELVQNLCVINAGEEHEGNLTVTAVHAEGAIVANVRSAMDVTVLNQGPAIAKNIGVKLFVDEGLPALETISQLAAGESKTVRLHPTLSCESAADENEAGANRVIWRRMRVELKPDSERDDVLASDSRFYFPAQVRCGIRVLVVDGDPGSENSKSESYYLRRALAPVGPANSGVSCVVIGEDDLETARLADFDILFLLNTSHSGNQTGDDLARIGQWVAKGGCLVLLPGDQTDVRWFNSALWQNGQGLSPLKLNSATSEEGASTWVGLRFLKNNQLLPRLASEPAFVNNVKVFRHWQTEVDDRDSTTANHVVARFNDNSGPPAIAEKVFGDGRVVTFAIPADADWHNWPGHPSYVLLMQDLVHALAPDHSTDHLLSVGEAIHQPIDVAQFEMDATVEDTTGLTSHIQAVPPKSGGPDFASWSFNQPIVRRLGFHSLKLTRRGGGHESAIFAANADRQEGDLKRADISAIKQTLPGKAVQFVAADDALSLTDDRGRSELWQYFAWFLIAVLATEQALGWYFGRERT